MKRKDFLTKTALASLGLGAVSCGSPQRKEPSEQNPFEREYYWKMVTTWPPNFPILGETCQRFAGLVKQMSGGRMEIKVFGAGELIPALESFEAVRIGIAEIGHGASYYWAGKVPAAQFFAAVPFGMNAQMLNTWLLAGDGLKLWEKVYADYNLIPVPAGNSGVQMGGWFNKKINGIDDLKGLKIRMPGLGGKVITRAGASSVLVAGGEIYTNLERGVIDATEWLGPFHDYLMGFQDAARYYYTPGWHEPGSALDLFFNKEKTEALPSDLQAILKQAALSVNHWALSRFEYENARYMEKILTENKVEVKQWPAEVLSFLKQKSRDVLEEEAQKDPLSTEIYNSYKKFQASAQKWSKYSEKSYHAL